LLLQGIAIAEIAGEAVDVGDLGFTDEIHPLVNKFWLRRFSEAKFSSKNIESLCCNQCLASGVFHAFTVTDKVTRFVKMSCSRHFE